MTPFDCGGEDLYLEGFDAGLTDPTGGHIWYAEAHWLPIIKRCQAVTFYTDCDDNNAQFVFSVDVIKCGEHDDAVINSGGHIAIDQERFKVKSGIGKFSTSANHYMALIVDDYSDVAFEFE